MSELPTLTKAQGAVIATRPARQPLRVMERSGLPRIHQATSVALKVAAAAAVLVVMAIRAMAFQSAAMVLPGLNPNQPNHRTKRADRRRGHVVARDRSSRDRPCRTCPSADRARGCPARAAHPPTECTTVEPAKSNMPSFASQPPPQIQ